MSRHRARRSVRATVVRLAVSVAGIAAAVGVGTLLAVPGAYGAFIAQIGNNTDTVATNTYFTCDGAAYGETGTRASFAWPLNENAGFVAADSTGNLTTGRYTLSGVTYGSSSTVCPRDTDSTVVSLNGSTGYVVSNTLTTNPQTFTEELWFRTSTANGKLIGFGSSASLLQIPSATYDRHIYFDSTGALRFGVYPNGAVQTVVAPTPATTTGNYADGNWHYVAASLSTAGMKLYVDGGLVAANAAVTSAQIFNGYWHVGFDNLTGWTNTPSSNYFRGSLSRVAVYSYALSAAQVASHYRAGVPA